MVLEELRNQIYRYVFDDGKVTNLKLLQTCKQINGEACAMGFLNTTFEINVRRSKFCSKAKLLRNEQKVLIKSVSVDATDTSDSNVFQGMNHHSILPTRVILLASARNGWWLAHPYRKGNAGLRFIVSGVALYGPNERKIVVQGECIVECGSLTWMKDPDRQLRQMRGHLEHWLGMNKDTHDPSLKEKGRDNYGVSAVEISFRLPGEVAARAFTVQWDIVPAAV